MILYAWVPGILGSRLENVSSGEEVWPPPFEDLWSDRTYAQLTADLEQNGIINSVLCFTVYGVMDQYFAGAGIHDLVPGQRPGLARLPFPYDWRLSIRSQAERLAEALEATVEDGDEIILLAHSMGTLPIPD